MTHWASAAMLALVLAPAGNDAPRIMHDGVECVMAGKFPRIQARIEASNAVARARVLFRSAGAQEWYEVTMNMDGGAWVGVLPQPKPTLKAFDYYIVVIDSTMGMSQTPEFHPFVDPGAGGCQGRRAAGALASAAIHLQAPAGAPIVPAGFANTGVVGGSVAGASTTGGSAAGAVAGGSSKGLVIALVGGGAAAAGIAAAAGGGDDKGQSPTPSSGTPGPSATPAPAPGPAPTPAPAPNPTPSPTTGTLTGRWVGTGGFSPDPTWCTWAFGMTLDLTQTGTNLSGSGVFTVTSASGGADCEPVGTTTTEAVMSGSVNGSDVTFIMGVKPNDVVTFVGKQSGNAMSGTTQDQSLNGRTRNGTWNATRQ